VAERATIGGLLATLRARHPFLGSVPFVVARNQSVARDAEPLRDGDELALLPPVSGG
jgi:molybdopterin converting factor small subunit